MARTTKHDVTPAWLGRVLDGRARWGPGTCLFCVPDWGQKQSKDPTCPILCFVPAASLVPHRKGDFASVVLRALLTGICVSMLNSCLAGLMYMPKEVSDCVTFLSTANFTSTSYPIYTCCKQLFASTVLENGTLSFTGVWDGQAESMRCLTQCCGHYNHTSCTW
nr:sodium/nucleoside cotransporter 1-like [Anser cygnoides]